MLDSSPPISSRPASPDDLARHRLQPHIALFVEDTGGDWHARRLKEAMEERGARVSTTTLKACAFDTSSGCGLDIPGFDGALPDGAFVRSISTGSLEQITFRLGILHALRESGVRVWNDARVIERCVDKSTATFLFQAAGLPVPRTVTVEGRDCAAAYVEKRNPTVSKPLFGSQGNGVCRIASPQDLPAADARGGVYYLQDYVGMASDTEFQDWRILVSGGRVLGAMTRRGEQWVTNIHQGAVPTAYDPDEKMQALALAAAKATGADYAGVDLIAGPDGQLLVLEINSNPAWKGLQKVCDTDIAASLASDFLTSLSAPIQK